MTLEAWIRLVLVFSHLMVCAFALHLVVKTGLRVLRRHVSSGTLMRVNRRMTLLLAGLWLSGAAILVIDYGHDLPRALDNPKLLAKLLCVLALSTNALVLRYWALPRLSSRRPFSRIELGFLASTGAVSSASWFMAAFIGIARPMVQWSHGQTVGLYLVVLGTAVLVSLLVCPGRLQRRAVDSGHTAEEEAAETLAARKPAASTHSA